MKRALLIAFLLAASACSGSGGPTEPGGGNENPPTTNNPPTSNPPPASGPQTHTITLGPTSFSPANLTIRTGDTVIWVNDAAITHTVSPQGHSLWQSVSTGTVGEVMRMTFNTAGSYAYFCQPHSATMTGVIVVQ